MAISMKKAKKPNRNLLVFLLSLVLSLTLAEIILHISFPFSYEKKDNLGWSAQPNLAIHREIKESANETRIVTNTYYDYGFKRWGNLNSDKKKILLVGDSFTEMPYVTNGEEYYSYLEDNFEMFVYGKAGYGTLQEFMVIDIYLDEIKPDIIVVQFDPSDILDNDYSFDRMRYPYNSFLERPYLEDGKIVYRSPVPFETLRRLSRIADITFRYLDKVSQERADEISPFYSDLWSRLSKEQNLLSPTILLMEKIAERSDSIPIFLFSTTEEKYYHELCENIRMVCIKSVSKALESAKLRGYNTTIYNDPHWNEFGNHIAGIELLEYLKNEN